MLWLAFALGLAIPVVCLLYFVFEKRICCVKMIGNMGLNKDKTVWVPKLPPLPSQCLLGDDIDWKRWKKANPGWFGSSKAFKPKPLEKPEAPQAPALTTLRKPQTTQRPAQAPVPRPAPRPFKVSEADLREAKIAQKVHTPEGLREEALAAVQK